MEYGVIGSVFIFPIHRDNSGALQIATTMEREEKRTHTHETMPRSSNSVRENISFRHNDFYPDEKLPGYCKLT